MLLHTLALISLVVSPLHVLADTETPAWGGMILRRAEASDVVSFDDMPSCPRKQCTPYQAQKLGCLKDLNHECFCANMEAVISGCKDLTYYCNEKETFLGRIWASSVCLGFQLDAINQMPSCAQGCLEPSVIRKSCSLSTFDCFCQAELPSDCLEKCGSADTVTANKWRAGVCAISPSVKGSQTYTIPAEVKTVTQNGKESVQTVAPPATTVVAGNTNANAQNININTGGNGNANGNGSAGDKLRPASVLAGLLLTYTAAIGARFFLQ